MNHDSVDVLKCPKQTDKRRPNRSCPWTTHTAFIKTPSLSQVQPFWLDWCTWITEQHPEDITQYYINSHEWKLTPACYRAKTSFDTHLRQTDKLTTLSLDKTSPSMAFPLTLSSSFAFSWWSVQSMPLLDWNNDSCHCEIWPMKSVWLFRVWVSGYLTTVCIKLVKWPSEQNKMKFMCSHTETHHERHFSMCRRSNCGIHSHRNLHNM